MDFKNHIDHYTQQNAADDNVDLSSGFKSSDHTTNKHFSTPKKNVIPDLADEYYDKNYKQKYGTFPDILFGYDIQSHKGLKVPESPFAIVPKNDQSYSQNYCSMEQRLYNFRLFDYDKYFTHTGSKLITEKYDKDDNNKYKAITKDEISLFFRRNENRYALLRKRKKNGIFNFNPDFKYDPCSEEESKKSKDDANDYLFNLSKSEEDEKMDIDDDM